MATVAKTRRKSDGVYLDLIRAFPLASIRSENHLRQAQQAIDHLLAKGKLAAGETMYLDALADLVAIYEDQHHAIPPATDADMLQHFLEARGISQMELHRQTKIPKSTISEILSGKKTFSRAIIRTLADFFHVDPGLLAANF